MFPRLALAALASLACAVFAGDQTGRPAPAYAAASIVNLANGVAGDLAPNTLAAIYGENLAHTSRALRRSDLQGDSLPFVLPGTGVTVKVNGLLAAIIYVSAEVVTFVVPSELMPGPATVSLSVNALSGPVVRTELQETAPALFLYDNERPLARHAGGGGLVDPANPAVPGESVIVYATGLGATTPPEPYRKYPSDADPLADPGSLEVLLDGRPLDRTAIWYAGLSVGSPGVYEVRFRLPEDLAADPEVVLSVGGRETARGLRLPVWNISPQPIPVAPRSVN